MSGNFAIKGGGVGRLMANAILNFHFDFLHTSLIGFTGQLTSLGLQRRSAIALARGQSLGVRFTEFTNSLHIAVSPKKSFQRFPLKDDLV